MGALRQEWQAPRNKAVSSVAPMALLLQGGSGAAILGLLFVTWPQFHLVCSLAPSVQTPE